MTPLLRAPPFPWVAADVAAVSAVKPGAAPVDAARLDRLIAMIRDARVGGSFWAPPVPNVPEGATIVRAGDAATLDRLVARAAPLGEATPRLVLPEAPWARAAGGAAAVFGDVDPWSLLGPGSRLIAAEDDEWRAIAAIAGATVIDADPATLRAELGRRLLGGAAYRDCFSGDPADAEQAVATLALWRRRADADRDIAAMTGISWWKRQAIERFLWADRPVPLVATDDAATAIAAAMPGRTIAAWPSRMPEGLAETAAAADIPIAAIEDGFVRSVGLGSNLHVPRSIVVDRSGIYYDPDRPSDLETILATADFPPALLDRAEALRRTIVARGISKYASDAAATAPATVARDRRTILVTGQVEDDMSVRAAGGGIGNWELLRRARAAEPDARLLFRPHPDVDAGHRIGRIPDAQALTLADAIERSESMARLLGRVDAVHVLTSQTGFEAVLRGIETIVHGRPFYAGWGLTTDLAGPFPRRGRALSVAQLVAGALILYPRYWDPETELPCPPEVLLDRFAAKPLPRTTPLIALRRLQGRIARLLGRATS